MAKTPTPISKVPMKMGRPVKLQSDMKDTGKSMGKKSKRY